LAPFYFDLFLFLGGLNQAGSLMFELIGPFIVRFPDWQETKPLEQAKRQAYWLSKWLSSAVVSSVYAIPALALPGWYVERTNVGDVTVFNGKNPIFLSRTNGRFSLGKQQIQQISHQIEQRCRDVEPVAYRKANA
jgi:hypothetical protein